MTETDILNWRESSFSGGGDGDGNTRVEIAPLHTHVAIRDWKAPSQGTATVPLQSLAALVESLKTATR